MVEEAITTEVDALLALVEQRKRISIEESARELNISPSVVEKLATFLEEEALLEIKYQLTTPYLVWKEPEKKPEKKGMEKVTPKLGQHIPSPAAPKIERRAEITPKEERNIETAEEAKEAIRDVYSLLAQGKTDDAKGLYRKLHTQYETLPRTYITARKELEQELVKLNTELTTIVDRQGASKVKDAKAKIGGLLAQGQKLLKTGDWKTAAKVYNEIKSIYRSLPAGFVKEKTELSEKVLAFYEQLSAIHHELARKEMSERTSELNALLGRIRQAMSSQQLSEAISLYNAAKEKYASLPTGFLDEKLALQERMLILFRDLSIAKKTYSSAELQEKAGSIVRFLDQINDALAKGDIEKALVHYKQVKELYSSLPSGFLAEQRSIHDNIVRTYKRLVRGRSEHAVASVKFGGVKINDLAAKARHYLSTKQHDLATQLYKEIIDEYNLLPEGYAEEKAYLRNLVYDLYYNVISTADIAQLGYLDDYTKERYFGLLKLLVAMHKVIDSGEFPLIPELYAGISRMYTELPLKVVQQQVKLVQEVNRAYSLMRIYEAVQKLDDLKSAGKHDELRQTLGFLGVELIKAGRESPEDKMLLVYAKDRYMRYMEYAEGKRSEIPLPVLPKQAYRETGGQRGAFHIESLMKPEEIKSMSASTLLAKEERLFEGMTKEKEVLQRREHNIRARLDQLTQCKLLYEESQQHLSQNNYNEAIISLGNLLAIDPTYPNARNMMNNLEKIKMDEYRRELLVSLVKSKKEKAIMRLAEHDYGGAIAYIKSILELDPKNIEAQYMLQTALEEKGR